MSLMQTYVENLRAMRQALMEQFAALFPKRTAKVG
jgi:hypothetical protein